MATNVQLFGKMATVASAAAGTAGYVWEDPGDSIMIQVSLDLVERLSAAVQQGLGAGPRGNEIGGVLLLGTRLARRAARQVVGYFRSQTRPGLYLDQDDFAVFSQYFPEPWQVFLLVRPSTEGPAMGGFFFWEDGDINRRSPYRQFPFDRARLAEGDFPITGGQPAVAPAPRPVPVLVPKPEAHARRRLPPLPWLVVPIIAVLFLIAGLFVSENPAPTREAAAVKASPPVEPLLPEPV